MNIQRLDERYVGQTLALLDRLRVSLVGISSRRLHAALVSDAVQGRIDCRIAHENETVHAFVMTAPASYWRMLLLRHWAVAAECVGARLRRTSRGGAPKRAIEVPQETLRLLQPGPPPRSWDDPGDAWRIIFVGTSPDARGRGTAARLYRSLMADRSLVARIALDNTGSIRLHHSVGWRLYRDGHVVLAVYLRGGGATTPSGAARPARDP
jgi:hypothetical protein